MIIVYRILVGILEVYNMGGFEEIGDNIKPDLKEIGHQSVNRIQVAQDSHQ